VYFGGMLVFGEGDRRITTDRLGSTVRTEGYFQPEYRYRYYPYGEQQGGSSNEDQVKFGTYWRDSVSGLDYAQNRYFAASQGRFTSADPSRGRIAGKPQSWNKYSYVTGDPINRYDPSGLLEADPNPSVMPDLREIYRMIVVEGPESVEVTYEVITVPQPAPTTTGTGSWMPTVSMVTNSHIRPILLNRLDSFQGTHCNKIFNDALKHYTFGGFWSMALAINFYIGYNKSGKNTTDLNLTQDQVSGNGSPVTLANTLGGASARTITNGIIPAIVLSQSAVDFAGLSNTLLHELLHAFLKSDDDSLFTSFAAYGLNRPGDGSTSAISRWIGTDCNYTPE